MTEKKQKWNCDAPFSIRRLGTKTTAQEVNIYITYENDTILAKVGLNVATATWIRKHQSNTMTEICYSYEFSVVFFPKW
ncbi:Hypothetical predicted protein [Paramuricea clavata]|nr:Hypothetical predicted protein [Paramuricea clavata]